jgi:very-short-patch-repair endonuclease
VSSNIRKPDGRVPRARQLRRDMTIAEKKLWRGLREFDDHFRRQATIGPFFVDFVCYSKKLVIEVDGGQHNSGTQAMRDGARDAFLIAHGYRVLRFWNNDVMDNVAGVLSTIEHALRPVALREPPAPDPSPPQAGEGESRTDHDFRSDGEAHSP